MLSWRNLTLQFLCLFLCSLHLTRAACAEYLSEKTFFNNANADTDRKQQITTYPLVDAPNLKDMMTCTLLRVNETKNVGHVLRECMDMEDNNMPSNISCGKELPQKVSVSDFACLIAKSIDFETNDCSHEVVVNLYLRFGLIQTTTLPSPTREPLQTTAKLKTTIKSTTTETTTSPLLVTSSSTNPPTTITHFLSPAGEISSNKYNKQTKENEQTNKVPDGVVHSVLGLSLIANLLLAFSVAVLCRKHSNHGKSVNSLTQNNGHYEMIHLKEDTFITPSPVP